MAYNSAYTGAEIDKAVGTVIEKETVWDEKTVFVAQSTEPEDTRLLWMDTTAQTGGLKYYNGTAWVHVPVAYT